MALTQLESYMVNNTGTSFTFANVAVTNNATVTGNTNVTGNITAGNINAGNVLSANYITGALTTAAQPNITSVGTLTTLTVTGSSSFGVTSDILLTKTGATSTVAHDLTTGAVFYHTSPAANFTVNFTSVPTTDSRVLMVTLIISQGATPYLPVAVQIDSVAQTIKWVSSSSPTATPNKIDIISFTLLRTGSSWIVLGQASVNYG